MHVFLIWPVSLPIGKPPAADISSNWEEIAATIRLWRDLPTGKVIRETTTFRAAGAPIDLPVAREIPSPDERAAASHHRTARAENEMLRNIVASTDPISHSAFVRERSLWKN
jgi:hypothetical protein